MNKAETDRRIGEMYAAGALRRDIVAATGAGGKRITRVARALGLKRRPGYRRLLALDEQYFDVIDTPTKAYWLGFVAADGHCEPEGCLDVELSAVDRGHLEALKLALSSGALIRDSSRKSEMRRLRVSSVHMIRALAGHGVGRNKTHDLKPWQGPPHLMRPWWMGFWDGDGTLSVENNSMELCGTLAIADGMRKFAEEYGIFTGIVSVFPHTEVVVRYGLTRKEDAAILARILYSDFGDVPVLKRKADIARTLMAYVRVSRRWAGITIEELEATKAVHGTWAAMAASMGVRLGTLYKAATRARARRKATS